MPSFITHIQEDKAVVETLLRLPAWPFIVNAEFGPIPEQCVCFPPAKCDLGKGTP